MLCIIGMTSTNLLAQEKHGNALNPCIQSVSRRASASLRRIDSIGHSRPAGQRSTRRERHAEQAH